MFVQQLNTNLHRSYIRKKPTSQFNSKAKESSRAILKSENKQKYWESKSFNYLSKLIGFNGVSLSCVVWDDENSGADG